MQNFIRANGDCFVVHTVPEGEPLSHRNWHKTLSSFIMRHCSGAILGGLHVYLSQCTDRVRYVLLYWVTKSDPRTETYKAKLDAWNDFCDSLVGTKYESQL